MDCSASLLRVVLLTVASRFSIKRIRRRLTYLKARIASTEADFLDGMAWKRLPFVSHLTLKRDTTMSSNIAYNFARKRIGIVKETVEQWKIDHEEANSARDVDDLVSETIDALALVLRVSKRFKCGYRPGCTNDEIAFAHMTHFLLTQSAEMIRNVNHRIESVVRRGFTVERSGELADYEKKIATVEAEVSKKWMIPDEARMALAEKELAAGDYVSMT